VLSQHVKRLPSNIRDDNIKIESVCISWCMRDKLIKRQNYKQLGSYNTAVENNLHR